MKVDIDKLMDIYKETEEKKDPKPKSVRIHKNVVVLAGAFAICLAILSAGARLQNVGSDDRVLAETVYDETDTNPGFTVQHVADITKIDTRVEDGTVTVLTENGEGCAGPDNDGTLRTVTERVSLYDDYVTNWLETDSIESASFLTGSENFRLKEIWFGQDETSDNPSDFLILEAPEDPAKVTLTINPRHPKLSETAEGHYQADSDGGYVVCIRNGDVIRLVFEPLKRWVGRYADVFDYDVSDGGYYLEDNYDGRKDKHDTGGQGNESETVYVDATANGIHSEGNYEGDGAKFSFGGADIGTDLGDEFTGDVLNTINVRNYGQQSSSGITKGLISGVSADGYPQWTKGITAPGLFGDKTADGRTDYNHGEYTFTFLQNGFSKTLSAVESEYGTAAEGLEALSDTFWILDAAPSYGTDGHDPVWGGGSNDIAYYRTGGREPEPFKASDDGYDHNSFFGFAYTEDFVLSPGYTGPLEFYGYSDDDMWVFAARTDEHGRVIEDTVVQVLDMGGVHDRVMGYADMWDAVDKVKYGEDAQTWRLYIYWLERDGSGSSCYLNYNLPEAANVNVRATGSVVVKAKQSVGDEGMERFFVLDDGAYGRYKGTYDNGYETIITSGEEFIIPDGSFLNITGLSYGSSFTVEEIGAERVWGSAGGDYEETKILKGTVDLDTWMTFVSTPHRGELSVTVDADDGPDGGYILKLVLNGAGVTEILVMDEHNAPLGGRLTDKHGEIEIVLTAGETLKLYNLPENTAFTLKPETTAGWHITEMVLSNGETNGSTITGNFPAHVIYRYEKNEK